MDSYAVIDFETTGLSPTSDRVIEVGVVLVRNQEIVETFSELMDPGFAIRSNITNLTGISTPMVRGKRKPEQVMPQVRELIGSYPCIAHNASFDRGFLAAEMCRANISFHPEFLCSMLLARRLVQDSTSHKLGVLVQHLGLPMPADMRAHRALADCLMTLELWIYLMERIESYLPGYVPDQDFVERLSRMPKAKIETFLNHAALEFFG